MEAAADESDLDNSKVGYEWIARLPQQMLSIITQKKAVFSDCPLGQASYEPADQVYTGLAGLQQALHVPPPPPPPSPSVALSPPTLQQTEMTWC
jgi:hypothetical protein